MNIEHKNQDIDEGELDSSSERDLKIDKKFSNIY